MSTRYKQSINVLSNNPSLDKKENTVVYGKVTKVLHNTNNVSIEGGIEFSSTSKKNLPTIAYPANYHIQTIPLLGEVVPLYYNETLEKVFYGPTLNIHNFPTHNSTDPEVQVSLDYTEPSNINPYELFAGDTILQGRFGQSIRLSQVVQGKSPWQGVAGSSAIVIRSGQATTIDGSRLISEDINQDASSIYLLENGKLSLVDKYRKDEYEGNQSIISSDRIHLHARGENVIVRSQEGSIELNSNQSITLQDQKWQTTLTEIVDLIEILVNGGNITAQGPTGINAEALSKLIGIKNRIANGI